MHNLADIFFFVCAVLGVGGTLYYLIDAHWWRISSWREHRQLDRLIRRAERGER